MHDGNVEIYRAHPFAHKGTLSLRKIRYYEWRLTDPGSALIPASHSPTSVCLDMFIEEKIGDTGLLSPDGVGQRMAAMNLSNLISLFLPVAILLSGCANLSLAPSDQNLRAVQKIHIIPVESPPLVLNPAPKAMLAAIASAAPNNTTGVNIVNLPPVPTPMVASQIGGISNAIAAISDLHAEHPEVDQYLGKLSETAQARLIPQSQWIPMQLLASEFEHQLSGGRRPTSRLEQQHPLPGLKDRAITKWMFNWSGHTDHWYDQDIGLSTQSTPGEADLEFAAFYQFIGDMFYMNVRVKLIDPVTRHVIGKTRGYELIELSASETQQLFFDGGITYRQLFEKTAGKLIQERLRDIHLLQH